MPPKKKGSTNVNIHAIENIYDIPYITQTTKSYPIFIENSHQIIKNTEAFNTYARIYQSYKINYIRWDIIALPQWDEYTVATQSVIVKKWNWDSHQTFHLTRADYSLMSNSQTTANKVQEYILKLFNGDASKFTTFISNYSNKNIPHKRHVSAKEYTGKIQWLNVTSNIEEIYKNFAPAIIIQNTSSQEMTLPGTGKIRIDIIANVSFKDIVPARIEYIRFQEPPQLICINKHSDGIDNSYNHSSNTTGASTGLIAKCINPSTYKYRWAQAPGDWEAVFELHYSPVAYKYGRLAPIITVEFNATVKACNNVNGHTTDPNATAVPIESTVNQLLYGAWPNENYCNVMYESALTFRPWEDAEFKNETCIANNFWQFNVRYPLPSSLFPIKAAFIPSPIQGQEMCLSGKVRKLHNLGDPAYTQRNWLEIAQNYIIEIKEWILTGDVSDMDYYAIRTRFLPVISQPV